MTSHEQFLEKALPSNEDAEKVILGSIQLYNECGEYAFRSLVPLDFYNPFHRHVFQAMLDLWQLERQIDPITITEIMKLGGLDPMVFGGTTRITDLSMGLPHFSDISEYVDIVKSNSVRRSTIRLCNTITNEMLAGEDPVASVLELAESKLLTLNNRVHAEDVGNVDKGFWDIGDIVPTLEQQFKDYHAGIASGAATGMKELDEMLDGGGLQPGGIYVVAASEKTGKTSLALDWAYHAVTQQDLTVPIVTLEMSKENMAKRLYSAHAGIPYYMFRPGFYDSGTDKSYTRAIEGLTAFGKFPIKIADRLFGFTEIARNVRRVVEIGQKTGKPVKYVIIDYLQLIGDDVTGKGTTREQEVSRISRNLKKLAADLGIAIVIMSSLNREGLKEGAEPGPLNLRDSGAIAFDAEALMFLHNPAFIPGKPYEARQITDITFILSRQRNGPTGRFNLKFIGPYMQFMTEVQYRKFAQKKDEIPPSLGQDFVNEVAMDKLWDDKNVRGREEDPLADEDW
jgi:replicative DNA helicase